MKPLRALPNDGPLSIVKAGDRLIHEFRHSQTQAVQSTRIVTVTARTLKKLTVYDTAYDLEGRVCSRFGSGRIRLPGAGELEKLDKEAQSKQAEAEQRKKKKDAFNAREDVQLLRAVIGDMQVNGESGHSWKALLDLGADKLRQIKSWLPEA